MKHFLFLLSLATVLTVAGCSNGENAGDSQDQPEKEEKQNEESKDEEKNQDNESTTEDQNKAVKSALLDAQMSLVKEIRSYNEKIVAVQSDLKTLSETKEEKEKEKLKTSIQEGASEAQEASDQAVKAIESFEPEGELPEDMKSQLDDALTDLKAYFKEAKSALDTPLEADFSKADEKFKAFQEKISAMYKEVGLKAPNLSDEMK
ncbi:hypothetical protein [Pontibacillus marinus]|uniref:Lipoprotein n=1 Tax=Pontibacillus marinus BH030004 = DSM 16465 TaxID=1385511 RepID=A0A0A5G0J6_9BACI|nr:hypothetical protein [Pontibacillus marinus]KGX85549.1 hypothetical protein N783_14575 [Pontibacillus marinus BH030004 = DSM 16465]